MTPLDSSTAAAASIAAAIKEQAARLGFELSGIAPAVTPDGIHAFFDWLDRGFAGDMHYLERRREAYASPSAVLPGTCSVIMLGMNYRTEEPPAPGPLSARVSRYAWSGCDYHDVIREKLAALAAFVQQLHPGCHTRGVIDTAPLLERDFARLAGLGWFGKNTMLLNKRQGSWLFLAALLTDFELEYDTRHDASHCGTCTRCLEACPTSAFAAPYVLDARRCISYLTIEHRGPIPVELREPMGDWLFGCDVCQDVCPWNRKSPASESDTFAPRDDLASVDAWELLALDDAGFRNRFRHTPLARPKRAGLLRNAAIVLGNSGDTRAVPVLIHSLDDAEPVIRGAAAWALGRFKSEDTRRALAERLQRETDADVRTELLAALRET